MKKYLTPIICLVLSLFCIVYTYHLDNLRMRVINTPVSFKEANSFYQTFNVDFAENYQVEIEIMAQVGLDKLKSIFEGSADSPETLDVTWQLILDGNLVTSGSSKSYPISYSWGATGGCTIGEFYASPGFDYKLKVDIGPSTSLSQKAPFLVVQTHPIVSKNILGKIFWVLLLAIAFFVVFIVSLFQTKTRTPNKTLQRTR